MRGMTLAGGLASLLVVSTLALGLGLCAAPACAQGDFPRKPIRLIVPFPPGGPTDLVARPLGQKLSELLGQPVVIDNRGGAGGIIGAEAVAHAEADGYTLLMGTVGTHAINGALYRKLSYDPVRSFTPVALVAAAPVLLVANPATGITSVQQLLAQSRSRPEGLSYGSAGSGTPGHLTGEIFRSQAKAKLLHVPYKGSAQALSDLIGGQIPLMFDPIQSVLPQVRSGKIVALATSGAKRSAVLPELPTFTEAGVPVTATAWWAVFAPAGLPGGIAARLAGALRQTLLAPDVQEKLAASGIETSFIEGTAFVRFQQDEITRWGQAVRESGAQAD